MITDSEAAFEERVTELGLAEALPELRVKHWDTFGSLAFASSYVPGVTDDAVFIRDVVTPVLGNGQHPKRHILRRLYYESYTHAAADLKMKTERKGDEATLRKLPNPERLARWAALKRALPGIRFEGQAEPSNALVDRVCSMHEDHALRYIPWERCNTRQDEIRGETYETVWKPVNGQIVEVSQARPLPDATTASDLLLRYTLQRRGAATHMGHLMSYDRHEDIIDLLLTEYLETPPPGYAPLTFEQLKKADQEIWRMLASKCKNGIKRGADGILPCDRYLQGVLDHPKIGRLLQPLPGERRNLKRVADDASANETQPSKRARKRHGQKEREKDKSQQLADLQRRLQSNGGQGSSPKGFGKGKLGPRMPAALVGKSFQVADKRVCFAYNLPGGCSSGIGKGRQCPKGWHLCMEPGCQSPEEHSLSEHK